MGMEKTPEELLQERTKRIEDAIQLKVPDRVPVMVTFDFFAAKYAGITCEEAMYDYDKMMMAWLKTITDFQPDAYDNPFAAHFLGRILETLDYKQLKLPGHGVNANHVYQFIEGEYMKPDEYDAFLLDPSDFLVRTFWPRIFGALEPFKTLPPLHELLNYVMGIDNLEFLDESGLTKAFETLLKAKAAVQKMSAGAAAFAEEMERRGFPPQYGAFTQAPFDTISDYFRGMRGAILDMYRQPDKLLEATEKMLSIMLQLGTSRAQSTGVPRVFIPLHKGIDSFMSSEQYKTFYWPTLRKLIIGLVDEGLTPCLLVEGDCTSRLEIMGDIPKGKVVYHFESTDIFKAKEVLGNHVCIRGNVPSSLLCTGTPEEVKAYCQKLIDVVGKGGGYIMDAAAGLDEEKPGNVKAMIDFTKEYGVYG